jgi:hypothetical protein
MNISRHLHLRLDLGRSVSLLRPDEDKTLQIVIITHATSHPDSELPCLKV